MREAGPSPVLVGCVVAGGTPLGHCPGIFVRHLVAGDPLMGGTQRMVTSLFLASTAVQASMAAMAKRWPWPVVSVLTLDATVTMSLRIDQNVYSYAMDSNGKR